MLFWTTRAGEENRVKLETVCFWWMTCVGCVGGVGGGVGQVV